ncbi:MAG TPA: hypothetical protein VM115_08560 [Vicinamibacterales bacterium]|nr:hypothetical protein [Vicinamibacterales bacterium]
MRGKTVAQQSDSLWVGAAVAKAERQHRRLAVQGGHIWQGDRDEMT